MRGKRKAILQVGIERERRKERDRERKKKELEKGKRERGNRKGNFASWY